MATLIRRAVRVVGTVLGAAALLAVAFVGYVQLAWSRPVGRTVVALNAPRDAEHVRRGQYDLDDNALGAFVTEGLSGSTMPGFGRTLTKEQIADVTAFIRSWQASEP